MLVQILDRARRGVPDAADERRLGQIIERGGDEIADFIVKAREILDSGFDYDARRGQWLDPGERPRRGRPASIGFCIAWRFAATFKRSRLRNKKDVLTEEDIARYLRNDPELRRLAGCIDRRSTTVESIRRRVRAGRTK